MKFFFALFGLCLSVLTANAVSQSDMNKHLEMAKKMILECKTAESGTDNDVEIMLKADLPDTPTGHCMLTCMSEKMGVVSLPELQSFYFSIFS